MSDFEVGDTVWIAEGSTSATGFSLGGATQAEIVSTGNRTTDWIDAILINGKKAGKKYSFPPESLVGVRTDIPESDYSWGVERLTEEDLELLPDVDDMSDDLVFSEWVDMDAIDEESPWKQVGDGTWVAPVGSPPPPIGAFQTKDSGKRNVRPSGYQRDTQDGKARFDLLVPRGVPYKDQFLTRFAELLARGAEKYGDENWLLAEDEEDLRRFKSSAFRHFMQWLTGEQDEDHAAAVAYNLLAHETIKLKVEGNR